MNPIHMPAESVIGGIYFSPLLLASLLGVAIAWVLTRLLNRINLARFVWWPPLFFLALCVICTGAVGAFLIPF